jgi:hypothetical protein
MTATDATVAQLVAVVEDLADRLERIERGEEAGAHPALWLLSADVVTDEDADAAWAQFLAWVVNLQRRYQLGVSRLPKCWPQHSAVVEELVALWLGHVDAYTQAGYAPMSWHDGFERTLSRIKGLWAPECLSGEHTAVNRPAWVLSDFSDTLAAGAPGPWTRGPAEAAAPAADRLEAADTAAQDPTNPTGEDPPWTA